MNSEFGDSQRIAQITLNPRPLQSEEDNFDKNSQTELDETRPPDLEKNNIKDRLAKYYSYSFYSSLPI